MIESLVKESENLSAELSQASKLVSQDEYLKAYRWVKDELALAPPPSVFVDSEGVMGTKGAWLPAKEFRIWLCGRLLQWLHEQTQQALADTEKAKQKRQPDLAKQRLEEVEKYLEEAKPLLDNELPRSLTNDIKDIATELDDLKEYIKAHKLFEEARKKEDLKESVEWLKKAFNAYPDYPSLLSYQNLVQSMILTNLANEIKTFMETQNRLNEETIKLVQLALKKFSAGSPS